jgi:aerotaxis receptor
MAIGTSVVPTGVERVVGPDELFFSTTDQRGVIRTGNSVFVRISRFSLEELTGAPHSIVRHPDMPAGAYRLMWDRLLAGRPMGAYVQNLAKDGSHYWVFATVTPMPAEGFLSVRMAPRGPLFDAARSVYAEVVAAEREMARQGMNRAEVAGFGADRIEEHLRRLGLATYDAFLLEALPSEFAVREHLVASSYARSWAAGRIRDVLTGAGFLEGMLADLVERLDGYRTLSERLVEASARVLDMARRLDHAVSVAQRASNAVADTAPVLLNVANVMATPMHTAVAALEQLVPHLGLLREDVAHLRFRIALAGLHNDMVGAFAAEVADGAAPATSLDEVPLLCDALHDGVVDMSRTAQLVNNQLRQVSALVGEASARLDDFRRFLGEWRNLVVRHRAGATLSGLMGPIENEISGCQHGMELLRGLGGDFVSAAVPLDPESLEGQVARIRASAAA